MVHSITTPKQFQLEPFFKEQSFNVAENLTFVDGIELNPLLFDLLYSVGVEAYKPWNEPVQSIAIMFHHWEQSDERIANLFSQRKRSEALEPMKQQICFFIAILFWLNKQPVRSLRNLREDISKIEIKPVNVCERIEYIISSPNHHHSFTQLKQLFLEIKKKYAVQILKN